MILEDSEPLYFSHRDLDGESAPLESNLTIYNKELLSLSIGLIFYK